jgi:hypothetical protein
MASGQAKSKSARTTQLARSVIAAGRLKSSRTAWPSPKATTCEPAQSHKSAACPVAIEPGAAQLPTVDASTSFQVQAEVCPVAIEPGAMLPSPWMARPHPPDASTSPAMAARPHPPDASTSPAMAARPHPPDASTSPAMAARPHHPDASTSPAMAARPHLLDASTSFQVEACPVAIEPGAMLPSPWMARPHFSMRVRRQQWRQGRIFSMRVRRQR